MREYHVRICEGLGVKFPGSTRQEATFRLMRRLVAEITPRIFAVWTCLPSTTSSKNGFTGREDNAELDEAAKSGGLVPLCVAAARLRRAG